MFGILRIIWVMVSLDRSRIWMSGKYSTKFLSVHYGPNSQMTPISTDETIVPNIRNITISRLSVSKIASSLNMRTKVNNINTTNPT